MGDPTGPSRRPPRLLPRRHRRPPAGSAPGTIQVAEGAPPPRITLIQYDAEHLEERVLESVGQIPAQAPEGGMLWLNVDGLGDARVIEAIGERFNLHPLALADVVHVDQRAKTELYDQHLFLVLRMLHDEAHVRHEQLSLFLGKGFVLTFQERAGDCFGMVRERLRKTHGRIRRRGADYLAYALLDAVIDQYFHPLEAFGDRLDALEAEVLKQPTVAVVHQLHALKRELLVVRRAVWPVREAVNVLLRDESGEWISEGVRPYLRDCYDHSVQAMDMVETFRELAASQMELYLSTVSQRTNETMKVLTMFASIFIPLTFIAGVYGMNFDPDVSPWNMPELRWFLGYPAALLFMAAVTLGILWLFRRRGWFG